ncbi:MAG TPA: CBS domain-containing protein [Burkholderiales bacterium]|nr:CBS domain-containing protein [Burkholderiales bacterium]
MEWIADPAAWVALLTLVALEIVLGVDNLIFLAILADKLPPEQRDRARIIGLSLALVMRLGLLASITWVMSLTAPLFEFWRLSISWRDLILIGGGAFLLIKATTEIHERVQAAGTHHALRGRAQAAFWPIIGQIIALDAVFSLDSIITAVGMVDELAVMMIAVIIAVLAMLVASKPLTAFITARPSLIILCLGFLLMIGLVLVADGFGFHIPKGYVYAAIGFSVLVEILNQLSSRNRRSAGGAAPAQPGVAEAVLRLLAGVPLAEKKMVEEVLTLGDRQVHAIMTPRSEVTWLDATVPPMALLAQIRASPHREFPVGRGSIDHVIGLVRKEEVLARYLDGEPVDLNRVLRPPLTLLENASVLEAVAFFKREPAEMAVVVDAQGRFQGVVTREDLLEAIAGDMPDSGLQLARRG